MQYLFSSPTKGQVSRKTETQPGTKQLGCEARADGCPLHAAGSLSLTVDYQPARKKKICKTKKQIALFVIMR
jgi:hypothetical protein